MNNAFHKTILRLQAENKDLKERIAKLEANQAKRDLEQQALGVEKFCLPFSLRGAYGDIVWEQGKKVAQELRKQAEEL